MPQKPPQNARAFHRWKADAKPLHVCDRWVSAARVRRKAFWLVFNPIFAMHAAAPGVSWKPGYAVKFCREALAMGFLDSEICAAWRVGLDETQASAVRDRDAIEARRDRAGWVSEEWRPRDLSQCVARAWLRLRADERSDEERWAAIFSGSANPQKIFETRSAQSEDAKAAKSDVGNFSAPSASSAWKGSSYRTIAPGLRVRADAGDDWQKKKAAAKKMPDLTPALARASMGEAATFESYLKTRGLKLADVLKMPRAAQQTFVREMHAWQKARRENEVRAAQKDTQNPLL